jgi:hypothetical protein
MTPETGLPVLLKDMMQSISWLVASIGGVIAAFKAIAEAKQSRIQRERDLLWKQAGEAKVLLDDMEEDSQADAAMIMLDWTGRQFQVSPRKKQVVTWNDVYRALRTKDTVSFKPVDVYVRDCFDHLFYHLNRIGLAEVNGLVRVDDVRFPITYLLQRMKRRWPVFESFLHAYGYEMAARLLAKLEPVSAPSNLEGFKSIPSDVLRHEEEPGQ